MLPEQTMGRPSLRAFRHTKCNFLELPDALHHPHPQLYHKMPPSEQRVYPTLHRLVPLREPGSPDPTER